MSVSEVYFGLFPVGFGLYLEMICVFLARAILVNAVSQRQVLIFLLIVALSTHISIFLVKLSVIFINL